VHVVRSMENGERAGEVCGNSFQLVVVEPARVLRQCSAFHEWHHVEGFALQ